MHEALSELAAGALRPIVAEALAKVERVAALGAVLAVCVLLAAAALIGLVAAGAIALAPTVGAAWATAIGAGSLLAVALGAGLMARRALLARAEAPRAEEKKAEEKKEAAAEAGPKGPRVDPLLIAAACVTATVILGPARLVRAVRGTVEAIRLAASLMAGAELVKSLDQLFGALKGGAGTPGGVPGPGAPGGAGQGAGVGA